MKTFEEESKNCLNYFAKCSSCGEFEVKHDNIWFDEKGYGYSTKLTKCPHCGRIVILGYKEDYGFSRLNIDERYYK